MSRILRYSTVAALVLLGTVLGCSLVVQYWQYWPRMHWVGIVQAQDDSSKNLKTIDIDPRHRRDAVKIVKITVAGKEITPGILWYSDEKPGIGFEADENWVKETTVVLKNQTSKTIAFAELYACIPSPNRTDPPDPLPCMPIRLGRIPDNMAYAADTGKKIDQGSERPLQFAPGQELVIPFADHWDDSIRSTVEETRPFSDVRLCNISFVVFYFEDGMEWSTGGYFAPDPARPGWGTPIERSYFPGTLPPTSPPDRPTISWGTPR